jgi:hypothetical protein
LPSYHLSNKERIERFMLIMHEPDVEQEFIDRVTRTTSCWLMNGGGKYPSFRNVSCHVASWILHNGAIPEGLLVLHTCDVDRCVYPYHLYLGTASDNAQDAYERGQSKQEKALDGERLDMARYAYVEMNLTQEQIARVFNVGTASVGRALNKLKRGKYTKRNKK